MDTPVQAHTPDEAARVHAFVIWWLTQEETEAVAGAVLPQHLMDAVESRRGRPGRGRLWESGKGQPGGILVPWPDSPMGRHLQLCGGIIVSVADAWCLATQPGLVTTFHMRRWPGLSNATPPGMLVMRIEHAPILQLVQKLEEATGARMVLTRHQTFAEMVDRMLAGTAVSVDEAAELATWIRTMNRHTADPSVRSRAEAVAAYIEAAQG